MTSLIKQLLKKVLEAKEQNRSDDVMFALIEALAEHDEDDGEYLYAGILLDRLEAWLND